MNGKSAGNAIERAGLHLPSAAKVTSMSWQTLPGRDEAYVYIFQVSRDVAADFCRQGDLGGERPLVTIPAAAHESLGDVMVTTQSRACDGSLPSDPRWYRFVLIDGGDPATVRLVLQYASR